MPQESKARETGPLKEFFEQYAHTFTYVSTRSATSEFHRLCKAMSWDREDPDQNEAYEGFRDALVKEFNKSYGTDANDLTSWQTLCAAVRIDPIPDTLAEARKAMLDIHVNLVDLTDGVDPSEIQLFDTEKELMFPHRLVTSTILFEEPSIPRHNRILSLPRSSKVSILEFTNLGSDAMSGSSALSEFFAQYPTFIYNEYGSATDEFQRLCRHQRWERGDPVQKAAYRAFGDALATQFNEAYGNDARDLGSWQAICRTLGIPAPDNLVDAKKAVFNTHVNIVDLTEGYGGARIIQKFPTEAALSNYTLHVCKPPRIFPRSEAAGTLLEALLRKIFDPPVESSARNEFNRIVTPGTGKGKRNRRR
ncbi:hypothetical protein MD484_g3723, partial [Candolleomyces efflorescens]